MQANSETDVAPHTEDLTIEYREEGMIASLPISGLDLFSFFAILVFLSAFFFMIAIIEGFEIGLGPWGSFLIVAMGYSLLPMSFCRKRQFFLEKDGEFVIQHDMLGFPLGTTKGEVESIISVDSVPVEDNEQYERVYLTIDEISKLTTEHKAHSLGGPFPKPDSRWLKEKVAEYLEL